MVCLSWSMVIEGLVMYVAEVLMLFCFDFWSLGGKEGRRTD